MFNKFYLFYFDYLEQIIKFSFCGGVAPMCVYNCVQRSRRGHVGGGNERMGGGRRGWEEGGIWQLQGEGQKKLPDIMKSVVMKINTL